MKRKKKNEGIKECRRIKKREEGRRLLSENGR